MGNKKEMNIIVAVVICLIFLGILIFISIKSKTYMPAENNAPLGAVSEGETAQPGDIVSMNYTGRLEDGTIFDSNVDPRFNHVEPFEFVLGAGQVIPGWDKGIMGMNVGEKKTLIVSPEDAYGVNGVPGAIPPNATLIFDVELVGIKN